MGKEDLKENIENNGFKEREEKGHRFAWLLLKTPIFHNTYSLRTPSVAVCYALTIINNNLKIKN